MLYLLCCRWMMKVAAAKGLISGHITIEMKRASEPVNVALAAMVFSL